MLGAARSSLQPAIFLVGSTCSGKSEVGRYLSSSGFHWIEPSKFIVDHVPLCLPLLDRLHAIDEFFRKMGQDFVAKRLLAEALECNSKPLVVTGCRQLIERDILADRFRTSVIALHSSGEIRFSRTTLRARKDAALDYATFLKASAWEYSLGLGRLIYEADTIIENNGTLPELYSKIAHLSSMGSIT